MPRRNIASSPAADGYRAGTAAAVAAATTVILLLVGYLRKGQLLVKLAPTALPPAGSPFILALEWHTPADAQVRLPATAIK